MDNGNALSTAGFITPNAGQTSLSLQATGPTHVGTWKIMATQDTASGPNPAYLAVTITVGCTIASIASPTAPTTVGGWNLDYNIYYSALEIDLSTIAYPQTPLCGYTVSETFAWSITPADSIFVESGEKLTVWTTDNTKHDTYTVVLTNTIVHSDGTFTPSMTFTVEVKDPCRVATIATVDVTSGISLKLGDVGAIDFLAAIDNVSTDTTMPDRCGPKTYVIVDPNNADTPVSWITTVAKSGVAGTYTITASPILETFIGT